MVPVGSRTPDPARPSAIARASRPGTLDRMDPLRTAELLSIGTELTVGETRDTNAGDLARELTERGVVVNRITALPDDLAMVTAAFADALGTRRPRHLHRRSRADAGRPHPRGDRSAPRRDA